MDVTFESLTSTGALVGHVGYILLILLMLMTRMLWLRTIAIAAGLISAAYYGIWQNDAVSMFWEIVFVLTNLAQIAIIIYRNSMARFTAEERAFYEGAVPSLEPAQARRLLKAGRWIDVEPGTVLVREGELAPDLAFIVSGEVAVAIGGHSVGSCGAGDFVGEISVSTGAPASATATAATPVRYLAFERTFLKSLLDRSTEIGRAVELSFRHGLKEKLLRANQASIASARPVMP